MAGTGDTMDPAATEEESGIAPPPVSALDQQPESVIPPTATKEEDQAAMEALEVMEILYRKISKLQESAGSRRVSHCFGFMKAELSATMVSLRRASESPLRDSRTDGHTGLWLIELKGEVTGIMELLGGCKQKQAERTHHSLLQKSAQLFARLNPRHNTYIGILERAERFLHVAEDPLRYKHLLLSSSDLGLELPPHPSVAEEDDGLGHVGIESQTKKLLRWLMAGDERNLSVMYIVGPAGVGKTSLAMEVYDQLRCQTSRGGHYFQCHAMAEWSRNPDIEKIHRHILSQITGTVEPSVRDTSELLRHKRYFILIDDIWTTSDWEVIKSWFPSNSCGSRILITTRTRKVARLCCSEYGGLVHEMKPLNKLDSERLLISKTFGSTEASPQDDIIKNALGKILRRCGGIPLFIIGMAKWLKQQLQQQQQQQQHEQWDSLEQVPESLLKRFEQELSPTYDDLPYMPRLLALYMSMFPEGYVFEKYHLITKWSKEWPTQGNVWGEGLKGADEYFLELVDRNIITQMANNRQNLDETEACRWEINYFMLQFLTTKSVKEGFILTSSTLTKEGGGNNTWMVRRLAHHHTNPELAMRLQRMDLSQTRSLATSGAADEIPFGKLSYLVVLDLESWEKLEDEQLLQICNCNMFMLIYLSIRKTRVSKIPRQINKLYSLTKLDVSHTQISELPLEVCELEHLRKLDLRSTQIRQLPEEIVKLKDLQDLLVGNHGMINPFKTATKVPQGISSIHKLETLAIVDLSESSASFVDALGDLKSLRVLAITWSFHQCTDTVNRSSLLSSIQKWKRLESLTIHCGPGCPMEFLRSLSDPPENLERFKVTTGKFDSVPKWIEGLKNLTFLQITVCKYIPHNLKILKDLAKLDCLVLGLEFIPTQEIVIESDGFNELQKFLVDCPVPWLTFKKGAMPKLTYLELKVCSGPAGQQRVPSGISNLQRIMEVALCYTKWCEDSPNVKMAVDAVKKEVAKHHNPINLFINDDIQEVDAERNDNLLSRAANCLEESRALFLHRGRLEQVRAWQSILQGGISLLPLLLLYCCWLRVSVSYAG
ncbi:unnamed protein product [Urochloa decumbens]|uniref:NB-ARC domain-containing protein n=1 Tax=Urochloa decumbens TaxID=240449 RepID=A0ABC9AYJ0_9POAL